MFQIGRYRNGYHRERARHLEVQGSRKKVPKKVLESYLARNRAPVSQNFYFQKLRPNYRNNEIRIKRKLIKLKLNAKKNRPDIT